MPYCLCCCAALSLLLESNYLPALLPALREQSFLFNHALFSKQNSDELR
jgi:hypothetical protein